MKKRFLAAVMLLTAFCSGSAVFAQDDFVKPNVFIDYFSRPSNLGTSYSEAVRNQILEGLLSTGRIEVIDVDSRSALKLEGERRNQDNISEGNDMERLAVMVEEGANYIITGHITNFSVNSKIRESDKKTYYSGTLEYTIKLINPNDGKLVNSRNFKHGTTFEITGTTADECGANLVKKVKRNGLVFATENFPLTGTIIELGEQKKDEVKTLYIDLGDAHGLNKKTELIVTLEREIAGRKSNKKIGKLQVESVEGDDITLCKVKDGKKEIMAAFNSGQPLVVKTVPVKEESSISELFTF